MLILLTFLVPHTSQSHATVYINSVHVSIEARLIKGLLAIDVYGKFSKHLLKLVGTLIQTTVHS